MHHSRSALWLMNRRALCDGSGTRRVPRRGRCKVAGRIHSRADHRLGRPTQAGQYQGRRTDPRVRGPHRARALPVRARGDPRAGHARHPEGQEPHRRDPRRAVRPLADDDRRPWQKGSLRAALNSARHRLPSQRDRTRSLAASDSSMTSFSTSTTTSFGASASRIN